jgi:hypothetical protein
MIKFNQLKVGDIVVVEYDGKRQEGEVIDLNGDEKQVCVRTGEQDFWYETDYLFPLLLDEAQLFKLGFQKQENEDGSVKFMKGAFRVLISKAGNYDEFDMWYREDRRHIVHPITVHEFQNHYLDMTKVHLEKGSMAH